MKALPLITLAKSDYEDLSGHPVAISDFKGKRVILNFWATWCRPCIEEMPSMLRAQELLGRENYVFVLASDQEIATIKKFQEKMDFDFTYVKFTGSLASKKINALPASFIFNSKGDFQFRVDGARDWDALITIEELKNIP